MLRKAVIKPWARFIKDANPMQKGYSPVWWLDRQGNKTRPRTLRAIRRGAEQEWALLLQNPANPWSHLYITTWTEARDVPRGSLNLAAISQAEPGSMNFKVGEAALGSPDTGFTYLARPFEISGDGG